MPEIMNVKVKGWTQTLEQSVTSAAGVDGGRRIYLDYPIQSITGVWDNSAGTGTNIWTYFKNGSPQAKTRQVKHFERYIILPLGVIEDSLITAADDVWITYEVWRGYMPLSGALTADSQVVLGAGASSGATLNFTGVSEMTNVTTGTPAKVAIEPGSGGLYVQSVKVITDGTNINLYVYDSDTPSYASLIYRLDGINLQEIDNSEWTIPLANTSVWVGYQDVGANATPANTTVEIKGIPLV